MPAILVLVAGGVDVAHLFSERAQARTLAEAAALAGARDLALVSGARTAADRAKAFADAGIEAWPENPSLEAQVSIVTLSQDREGVRVLITGARRSLFGALLPPGGWQFSTYAVATTLGTTPLCVIAHGDGMGKVLEIKDSGRILAPGCLVHSNEDVIVNSAARLEAGAVQAVKDAEGPMKPEAITDAPALADPFAQVSLRPPSACGKKGDDIKYESGAHTLAPGGHCEKIEVYGTATLTLTAGEHWFLHADLVIKERARLSGADVALFFDKDSKFEFKDTSRVSLEGREGGAYSGFLVVATRDNQNDFIITSDNVDKLDGVVYVPNAQLLIEGKDDVARDSAWTVIVAERLQLKGNPSLYVNADYGASDIPVPAGVGPRREGARLVE